MLNLFHILADMVAELTVNTDLKDDETPEGKGSWERDKNSSGIL